MMIANQIGNYKTIQSSPMDDTTIQYQEVDNYDIDNQVQNIAEL